MKQFVIIGNSAAGIAAIEAIRQRDKESKITVISDEDYRAYCRCLISYYLAGAVKEDKIFYRPESFYRDNAVELILNKKVNRVDPKKNRVVCADKSQVNYDTLLIATGSRPRMPEIKGIQKENVFGFRTLKDAKAIEGQLLVVKTVCVLGGGLIGFKAAHALKKRDIDVKVIIKSGQILSQMLDQEAAGLVQRKMEESGMDLVLGQDAVEIIGEGEIKAVKLDSNKVFGCSLVIVGKGVQPNIELVKDVGIKTGEGIITNNLLQTNIPNIYSAGDVCENFDLTRERAAVNALWTVAVEQGKIAGANMAGDTLEYAGSLGMNSLDSFGLPVVSLGTYKVGAGEPGFEELKSSSPKSVTYKKLVLKDNRLVGAVMVGDIRNSGVFLRLIRGKVDVSSLKDKMLTENFGYPDILDLVEGKEMLYV
jgi:nitrite reductase (NADH) large subunit